MLLEFQVDVSKLHDEHSMALYESHLVGSTGYSTRSLESPSRGSSPLYTARIDLSTGLELHC